MVYIFFIIFLVSGTPDCYKFIRMFNMMTADGDLFLTAGDQVSAIQCQNACLGHFYPRVCVAAILRHGGRCLLAGYKLYPNPRTTHFRRLCRKGRWHDVIPHMFIIVGKTRRGGGGGGGHFLYKVKIPSKTPPPPLLMMSSLCLCYLIGRPILAGNVLFFVGLPFFLEGCSYVGL